MRYAKDQKAATRQRILQSAGTRFKEHGIDGTGIAAVMADAGLTNGAFYAHFASKEDLVANVLVEQVRTQRDRFAQAPADVAGLRSIIDAYLSPEHRDALGEGCPSAALIDEIGRLSAATREAFTDELLATASAIAARLPADDATRQDALRLFAFMIGALQISRALGDRDLSDEFLQGSARAAHRLVEVAGAA